MCSNCQRSRGEHSATAVKVNSPVPKRRTSVIIKTFGSNEKEKSVNDKNSINKGSCENKKNSETLLKSSLKGDHSHSKGTSVQFGNNLPDVIGYSFSLLPNVLIITDVRFFGTGEFTFTAVAECSPLER
jgi:hypothetical protein